jgi:hypothetical protein
VRRHLNQVATSRIEAASEKPRKHRPKAIDWP